MNTEGFRINHAELIIAVSGTISGYLATIKY